MKTPTIRPEEEHHFEGRPDVRALVDEVCRERMCVYWLVREPGKSPSTVAVRREIARRLVREPYFLSRSAVAKLLNRSKSAVNQLIWKDNDLVD